MTDVALRFGARDDGLTAAFRRVNTQLDAFEKRASSVANSLSRFQTQVVAAFGITAVVGFAKAASDSAEAIDNLATRTGISIGTIQKLQLAAETSGLSVEATAAAIGKMQRALVEAEAGTSKQAEAFATLGLSLSQIRSLSPDQQFETIAKALAGVSDKAQQVAIGTDLLGRSFAEQLPVVLEAAKGFESAAEGLEKIGGPLSDQAISQLDQMGDSVGLTGVALKNMASELLAFVSPAIIGFTNTLTDAVKSIRILAGGGGEVDRLQRKLEILKDARDSIPLFFNFGYVDKGGLVLGKSELDKAIADVGRRLDDLKSKATGDAGLIEFNFGDFGVNAPNLGGIPTGGPRQPTPADRRRDAQAAQPVGLETDVDRFQLEEVVNQQHLDNLLAQTTAYAEKEFEIKTAYQDLIAQSRQQFGLEEINWEQIKSQSIADIAGGLFSSLASQNQKFAKAQQAIALAQAIWYTASGITNALRSVPFPANIVAAAKVAAVGAIQIAKIKATRFDGGGGAASGGAAIGGGGAGGDSGGSAVSREEAGVSQRVTEVTLIGRLTDSSGRIFADLVSEQIQDRDVVIFTANSRQASELGLSPS